MNEVENKEEQLNYIDKALDIAIEYGLEVEIIYYALKQMKQNPKLSPAEAIALGVTEWVK